MNNYHNQPQMTVLPGMTMQSVLEQNNFSSSSPDSSDESDNDMDSSGASPPPSQSARDLPPQTISPSIVGLASHNVRTKTPMGRPSLSVKTDNAKRTSPLGPTTTSINPNSLRQGNMNPPPSGKVECLNCKATHAPLLHCGLNDELNCNACGLYWKLVSVLNPHCTYNLIILKSTNSLILKV